MISIIWEQLNDAAVRARSLEIMIVDAQTLIEASYLCSSKHVLPLVTVYPEDRFSNALCQTCPNILTLVIRQAVQYEVIAFPLPLWDRNMKPRRYIEISCECSFLSLFENDKIAFNDCWKFPSTTLSNTEANANNLTAIYSFQRATRTCRNIFLHIFFLYPFPAGVRIYE